MVLRCSCNCVIEFTHLPNDVCIVSAICVEGQRKVIRSFRPRACVGYGGSEQQIEVSQLKKNTQCKVSGASCHRTVSGKIPKAFLKESEDSVSKCLLLAWDSLAPEK